MYCYKTSNNELYHHGVLGMKWGIRRYQPYRDGEKKGKEVGEALLAGKGYTIKKGTTVSRISSKADEREKGVRKYVSISEKPEETWKQVLKKDYASRGYEYMYTHSLKAMKDMKVSSAETNVNEFWNWVNSGSDYIKKANDVVASIEEWSDVTGGKKSGEIDVDFFKSMVMINDATKSYQKHMVDVGYDAIADIFGIASGGKKSIIVLNPDKTLQLKKVVEKHI